jgi:magnesium-transporting ATPase (P-type)
MFGRNLWSSTQQATVLRNGKSQPIPIVEVLVGDICLLKTGKFRKIII